MTTLVKPTPSNNLSRGWIPGTHRGIDYGWQTSRPEESMKILAAAAGIVLDVYTGSGYNQGWGRRIRIDHGHGNVTTYNHMRPGGVLVGPGQQVSAGQLIAHMGSSGAADGTHLHFELYINGTRVDPAPYFSQHLPGTGPSNPGNPASGGGHFNVPAEGQYYYWQYDNALNGNYAPNQLLRGGQTLPVVENPGTGPVRVRCADGDLVWVGTRNNPAQVSGGGSAPAPTPSRQVFDVPAEGQYYYWKYENALSGNYDPSQLLRGGQTLDVVNNPGTGPVQVRAADGDLVWVGTRNHPANVRVV